MPGVRPFGECFIQASPGSNRAIPWRDTRCSVVAYSSCTPVLIAMQDSLYYSWVTVPAVPWLFPSQCNAVNRQRPLWSMKFTNWEDDEGSIAGALE